MATRIRRGKTVEIPEKWVGRVPHAQTIRKRASNQVGQAKDTQRNFGKSGLFKQEYLDTKRGQRYENALLN